MLVESTFERVDCVSFYNVCRKSVPKVYDPETEEIGPHIDGRRMSTAVTLP